MSSGHLEAHVHHFILELNLSNIIRFFGYVFSVSIQKLKNGKLKTPVSLFLFPRISPVQTLTVKFVKPVSRVKLVTNLVTKY